MINTDQYKNMEVIVEHIKDIENCFYCLKLCSFLHK